MTIQRKMISLMVLALVLCGNRSFFGNKTDYDILTQKEIQYSENAENTKREIPEQADDDEETKVYITMYGKKYHHESCRYLKHTKKEITLEKARRWKYMPCTICDP